MTRRELMTARDEALKAGDTARFQELTTVISKLPMPGVKPLTTNDVDRWNKGKK